MVAIENTKMIICYEMRGLVLPTCTRFWHCEETASHLCSLISQGKSASVSTSFSSLQLCLRYDV